MKKILLIFSAALMLAAGACAKKAVVSTSYTYQPEIISMERDGSLTMRTWGEGRNRGDAVAQARKEAVHAVMFKQLTANGKSPAMTRALVNEPNAETKYRAFFNEFFADGGDYAKFVTKQDRRHGSNLSQRSSVQVKYGITVRVLRSELEQYLIDQGILKQ